MVCQHSPKPRGPESPSGGPSKSRRRQSDAARLTGNAALKSKYDSTLHAIRRVVMEQILLEVARIPIAFQLAATTSTSTIFPEIPDVPSQLVPNALHGWSGRIRKFLETNRFDKNVFIMVSYISEMTPLVRSVEKELLRLHLNPVVAKDHNLTDDLYNPVACLLCCSYGVAIFGRAQADQTHNPNVVYELGMMQLLKRPCVILKHHSLKKMPTDLLSKLYEDYTSRAQASEKLRAWWIRINQ